MDCSSPSADCSQGFASAGTEDKISPDEQLSQPQPDQPLLEPQLGQSVRVDVFAPANCSVCDKEAKILCTDCRKMSYCSHAHKESDTEGKHRSICFPAYLAHNSTLGRHLVLTKSVEQSTDIFKESDIMCAASSPCHITGSISSTSRSSSSICLSCFCLMSNARVCVMCKWPVCSWECENGEYHAKFECLWLTAFNILPDSVDHKIMFDVIMMLRLLLLRDHFPSAYKKLITLTGQVTRVNLVHNPGMVIRMAACVEFFTSRCNLRGREDLLEYLAGVVFTNAIQNHEHEMPSLSYRYSTFIFQCSSFIPHDCAPNTRIAFHNTANGYQAVVTATKALKPHAYLSRSYIPCWPLLPTRRRQKIIKEMWNFSCHCARCADPTELGSYISALICGTCKGIVLNKKPLHPCSMWKCQSCGREYEVAEIEAITKDIERQREAVDDDFYSTTPQCGYTILQKVRHLSQFIRRHSGITCHKNFYVLTNTRFEIADMLVQLMDGNGRRPLHQQDPGTAQFIMELSLTCLLVGDALYPGNSGYIGVLLYYLQFGQSVIHSYNIGVYQMSSRHLGLDGPIISYLQEESDELGQTRRKALEILLKNPVGSLEWHWGQNLMRALGLTQFP